MSEFNVKNKEKIHNISSEGMSQSEFESLDHDDQIDEILEPNNATKNYLKGIRKGVDEAINAGVPRDELKKITNWLNPTQSQLRQLISKHPDDELLLQKLVRNAVLLGMAIGQHNTFIHFEGPIKQGFKSKDDRQKGNRVAQKNKKERTDEAKGKIIAEADKIWRNNPSVTLDDVAEKIHNNLSPTIPRVPTTDNPSETKEIQFSTIKEWIRSRNPNSQENKISLASKTDQSS